MDKTWGRLPTCHDSAKGLGLFGQVGNLPHDISRATCYRRFSLFVVFALFASSAFAHGIHITTTVDGKTIHGRVTYAGDRPVAHCSLTAHDAAEQVLNKTETDDDGRFSLEAQWRCDYHLEAETADGHGGGHVVKAELLPGDLPPRENLPADAHSHAESTSQDPGDENPWTVEQFRTIQAKLNALQERLDAAEQSVRVRDVLGGLGYIFGVFGLYAIVTNRKKKTP